MQISDQQHPNVSTSGRMTVNVWVAISRKGPGPLVRIQGHLTAGCCNLIRRVIIPYARRGPFPTGKFVFQEDLSPIHTARPVRSLMIGEGIEVLGWAPRGPDFNISENVWGCMEWGIARRSLQAANADSIWQVVQEELERLRGVYRMGK